MMIACCLLCVCRAGNLTALSGMSYMRNLQLNNNQLTGVSCLCFVFCVSPHFVSLFVDRGEIRCVYVAMMVCCLLCVSHRTLDGLVRHDKHGELGIE